MNTVSPALSSPLLTSASWAVMNTLGNAAASAHDTSGGTGISASGAATTYCAWQPRPWPITRSPSRQPLTSSPTPATSPANSTPAVIGAPVRCSRMYLSSP